MTGQEIERAADLLGRAYGAGELSDESKQALVLAGDIGAEVGQALGVDGDGSDLLLVTILVDDSSSIAEIDDGVEAVLRGHNHCLEALEEESGSEVLVHTRYLNTGSLSPYSVVTEATHLDASNYRPVVPKTPLYRQSVVTLGAVMAKMREQKEQGRSVRAFTLFVTDGGDNASGDATAQHVRFLVRDMLEFSDDYIVAGMGIGSPDYFRDIFTAMGIPKGWILTADATHDKIRDVFRKITESLQLAAEGGEAAWHQLEAGPVSDD